MVARKVNQDDPDPAWSTTRPVNRDDAPPDEGAQTPTMALSTSQTPVAAASAVTWTARLAGIYDDVPTGTVQFKKSGVNQGTPQTVNTTTGVATLAITGGTLTAGTYPVTADYTPTNPDKFNAMTGSGLTQVVT